MPSCWGKSRWKSSTHTNFQLLLLYTFKLQKSLIFSKLCHSRKAWQALILGFQKIIENWTLEIHFWKSEAGQYFSPKPLNTAASSPFSAAGFQYKREAFVLESRHGARDIGFANVTVRPKVLLVLRSDNDEHKKQLRLAAAVNTQC